MARKAWWLVGGACAAAAALAWAAAQAPDAMPVKGSSNEVPSAGPAQPAPLPAVVAPLPTPESAGIPLADCIAYPDGTRLPPLNGAKKAPEMSFHRLLPYTPIVRKEFDRATGLEWYIHANGARSTTRVMKDGRVVAEVDMPTTSQPVVDDK